MAKMDVKKLLNELNDELNQFTVDESKWIDFLRSAAWNYKYNFQNQLLIYSQRPDATACAGFDVWNNKLHRYIIKGSKGVAILNDVGDKVSYVFDVKDTRGYNHEDLKLWEVVESNYSQVLDMLNSDLSTNYNSLEDVLVNQVDEAVVSAAELYLPDGEIREDEAFVTVFQDVVKYSSYVSVLIRCGFLDAANTYAKVHLNNILNQFNNQEKLIALGVAVSSISEGVLREIERDVRIVNKENVNSLQQKNENVEVVKDENELQTGERLSDSGDSTTGVVDREDREDGSDEIEIPSSEQTDSLFNSDDAGRVGETFDGDRGISEGSDGTVNPELFGEESGTGERGESDRVGSTHEFDSVDGRADGNEGTDLPLEDVLFPTVQEQLEIIENSVDSGLDFEVSQEDIDSVLTYGSGFAEGKYRIYTYFLENHSGKEKAEFLKNEYGIGGGTRIFPDGKQGWDNHDSKGIKISKYRDMGDADVVLNWNKVQKRISELIKDGQYLNEKEMAGYSSYIAEQESRMERSEIANEYMSIIHEYNDYQRENGNEEALLNQYALKNCASDFISGRSNTHALSSDGDLIFPLMRDSLNTIIESDSGLKERAEAVLGSLQGVLVSDLEMDENSFDDVKEEDFVFVPRYKVGDLFFNGATKYNIIEINDDSVYLSNAGFELDFLELSKEQFEEIVKENPSNNHLLQRYHIDDYNDLINHANNIIDEVEKNLMPSESTEVVNLVQVGDFYEVRGESASRVAEVLGLNITQKQIDGSFVEMVGFPVVFLDEYNRRLENNNLFLQVEGNSVVVENEFVNSSDGNSVDLELDETQEIQDSAEIKRNSLIARNYDALNSIAPGILNGDYSYLRFESVGLEPLSIERVGNNLISIMHTYVQNGDMMRDPDIVVLVDNQNKTVTAASYEMSSINSYKEFIDFDTNEVKDVSGQKEINKFLISWFGNIKEQGYKLVRGETRDGVDVEFDSDGREVSPETKEGLKEEYQVRLYRPYNTPDSVRAYVAEVHTPLEEGHIVEDEREVYESRAAAEQAVENFNSVFEFDEEFRSEILNRVPDSVLHRYYSTQRPVAPGTYPKITDNEPINIVNFDDREFKEEINRSAWGYLEFEHSLTEKQVEDYELVKAPYKILENSYRENHEVTIDEEDKVAVRMQLDDNKDIFVYIERNDIPCPDSHIELGVFDTESAALKFCSHIDNLLASDKEYREKQTIALNEKVIKTLEKQIDILKPVVYCEFSEHEELEDGKEYSFVEFNSLMERLDAQVVKLKDEYRARDDYYPYFKTSFVIRFPDGYEYAGRQDIGDGDGSLLDHVRKQAEYNLKRIKEDGYNGFYKDDKRDSAIEDLERFLSVYFPMLEKEVQEAEISYDKEVYKIGYGSLGNGTTVWNSADIDVDTNDYRVIAHISDDGFVKFYVSDLPEGVKAEIKSKALDFSKDYINDVINMSEEKFKYWYFNQMINNYPSKVPGKDFKMDDYVDCYKVLHSDEFIRNVELPLVIQLENLKENKISDVSKDIRQDVIDKVDNGEISIEDISEALKNIDPAKIQSMDDVFDVLADKYSSNASVPEQKEKISNFKLNDFDLGVGGPKEKYRNNVVAIKLLNQLESEGRQATPDEQKVLSKYVGWGGLANAFDPGISSWSNEYNELRELLTTDEYRSAKASTLSAFYTPPVVINAIYDGLHHLGFKRGNVLEPSCGVGNFFGMLPDEFDDSTLYGVELDSISGRIAKQLYPEANIAVKGYEETNFKDSFFDVAIGNVPFGQFKVNDKEYNKLNFLIHDYFFAKTLDKVRPGGVIAFITSKGTLDKESPEVRKYIAQRAELLGAIRLPNNTFAANAGTKATSDIIFLKKRDKAIDIEPDWVHLGLTEDGLPINSYFVEHPEMVLGHMELDRMQYGREDTTCVPLNDISLEQQLSAAVQNIQGTIDVKSADFDAALDTEETGIVENIPADPDVRNFSFTIVDGDIYYRMDNEMIKQEFNPTKEKRVRGLIELRDSLRHLIDLQRYDYSDYEVETEQRKLNKLYDEYTAKYGLINSRGNSMAFQDDSSYYLLCSLENVNEKGELISKADMFTKRTIKRHVPVMSVGTASEALSVCISEKARVDLQFMSELADMPIEKIIEDLQGVIYREPGEFDSKGEPLYVTSDEYLSGNVREKLKIAKLAAESDHSFDINVMALKKVIPKDLEPQEISLRLGSTWVPDDIVNEFMWQLLNTPSYGREEPAVKAHYNEINGSWVIENKTWYNYGVLSTSTYGTKRMSAYDIIYNTLNLKTVEVYDNEYDSSTGKYKRVLNKNETIVAQQKQELIKNEFLNWVWKDPERRKRLVRIYNDKFNSIKLREYNGEHLVFEGMNPEITLMEHQRNAIAHAIYGGNTLLAHEVGAGKTFEMTAIAMESKRLGLCSKSLMVVPNHLIGQWASEFYQLYPSANLLVASKKDFEPANRKKFCSRIATGDYDAIIIGHSQFEKIPLSVELQSEFIQQEIDEIERGIRELEASGENRSSVKSLERTRKSLELRLEKLSDTPQDDVITFEELGVDRIFVDEAHYFKNLFLYTKMRNVAGISQTEAKKSTDLYMKTRYLNDLTGSKGVVFATGTPVSNSMAEVYTMQRYLQYYALKEAGFLHFDSWASTFGEVVTAVELAPEGTGYRAKTRFARFHNIPELMTLFKQVADIKTGDDLNLPKPEAEYHVVQSEPSKLQEEIVESLGERAKIVRDSGVDPSVDNMLKITNDGRLLGLDQRCFDNTLPDDPNSKVNKAIENVFNIWEENKEDKLAQLVFCDLSTPSGTVQMDVDEDGVAVMSDFQNIYVDIKKKLIAKGIPEEEIAFIHDANTDVKKDRLFAKVRSGEVRVLIGSTFKMGAGTNVQDKLIALHDLDCPWRPADLEQRQGRILRQGNKQEKVDIFRYVTKGTFDAYLWQLIENKQKFISQIMTSKSPVRVADDIDDAALSYAEIKSLCIKDPRIKEKMELDVEVAKLKLVKANFLSQKYRMEDDITLRYPSKIKKLEQAIIGYKADIEHVKECTNLSDDIEFSPMVVGGVTYTDSKKAGKVLLDACMKVSGTSKTEVGEYRGFKMFVQYDPFYSVRHLYLKGALSHDVELSKTGSVNLSRIDAALDSFDEELKKSEEKLQVIKSELETAKVEVQKEFEQEDELNSKIARLDELDALLRMDDESKQEDKENDSNGLDSVLSNAYSRAGDYVGDSYDDRGRDLM